MEEVFSASSVQKEVYDAITIIFNAGLFLHDGSDTNGIPGSRTNRQLHMILQDLTLEIAESSKELVDSFLNSAKLGSVFSQFSSKVTQLIDIGSQLASFCEDIEVGSNISIALKNVSISTSNLLVQTIPVSTNPTDPEMRNQLTAAETSVNDTLNQLLNAFPSTEPCLKECDNAIQAIEAMIPLIENPTEPINNFSYLTCQQILLDKSNLLGNNMLEIGNYSNGSLNKLDISLHSASVSICGILESLAQATYLIGLAESARRPLLFDMDSINELCEKIKAACQLLSSSKLSQHVTLSAATTIAKSASALCTACRTASGKVKDPRTKRQCVQIAKDIANHTAALVKEIKDMDSFPSEDINGSWRLATDSLVQSVNTLLDFALQPESVPASVKSRQEPIIFCSKNIIEESCNMFHAMKSLLINPKDHIMWQQFIQHSKQLSLSITQIVTTVRENAPGQKECENAIRKMNDVLHVFKNNELEVISQTFPQRNDYDLHGFAENAEYNLSLVSEQIETIRHTGNTDAENLGTQVDSTVHFIESSIENIIAVATKITEVKIQTNLLEGTQNFLESSIEFISAVKESGGIPKPNSLFPDLDLRAQYFQRYLDILLSFLQGVPPDNNVHFEKKSEDNIE